MTTYTNPAKGRISSAFNPRRKHPVTGKVQPHEGADVANATGTPVVAVHAGTVTRSETLSATYGRLQRIFVTSGSLETRYLHLSRRDVKVGQRVKRGQRIGLMGASGFVTGPHLHLEVRRNGVAVDPVPLLEAAGVDLGVGPYKDPGWYTVDTPRGVNLLGRAGPSTSSKIVHRRARGFEIYATRRQGPWIRTRYGTWYHTDHLKKGRKK
ncbi:M23 family metallopeptidase [Sanguibacter massiliensis]|uniref:M23 family metallopeptidase n=1 Tax=Sanguibacter massiliensis TaxID=1973217 RepID=UPI000C837385|nr:M23 family metallopeptidase [Sanguibacter massiliensis]